MPNIIGVKDLCKYYGSVTAVDSISFYVTQGEIFGFLGPNGAGKTTTINILTGLARPTSGEIAFQGADHVRNMKKHQRRIGIVPDESNLYDELSGFDNLSFCGSLFGMPKKAREKKAEELLALFRLDEAARRRYRTYSKGMKRKLTVAAALMHGPEVLFLDEPTTGIDVASARNIREMIKTLNKEGTTVFLTTHYIEEAERLCERIAFLKDGRIVKTGVLSELLAGDSDGTVIDIAVDAPEIDRAGIAAMLKQALPEADSGFTDEGIIRLSLKRQFDLGEVIALFSSRRIPVREARLKKRNLEDVFVSVTGIDTAVMKKEREKK